MQKQISPAKSLKGVVRLPGDKSISHRAAMLASIAEGQSILRNYSTGADCQSTLDCMSSLGAKIQRDGTNVTIQGTGLTGLHAASSPLDVGNSGSTIRMLSGILAGQPFESTLIGDESIARRPMQRVIGPLGEMGCRIDARDGKFTPLILHGSHPLKAIDYTPPVASAQVKTCVLFAGMYADGKTIVRESVQTRDHSEMALREFGAEVESAAGVISIEGHPKLTGREFHVPGDLSSAAFFLVGALLIPGSQITIENVGLNPTRTALLDYLMALGAPIRIRKFEQLSGEMVGDIDVHYEKTKHGVIEGALTAALIDEIPVLAILGAAAGGLTVKNASELRVKETDRIATVADNFARAGVSIETTPDGFTVPGGQKIRAAAFDSCGDHRIAMAFAIASLISDEVCTIEEAQAASVSFPEFYEYLDRLTA